jgi:hypothetical protein
MNVRFLFSSLYILATQQTANARINPPPANGIQPPTQGSILREMLSGGRVQ